MIALLCGRAVRAAGSRPLRSRKRRRLKHESATTPGHTSNKLKGRTWTACLRLYCMFTAALGTRTAPSSVDCVAPISTGVQVDSLVRNGTEELLAFHRTLLQRRDAHITQCLFCSILFCDLRGLLCGANCCDMYRATYVANMLTVIVDAAHQHGAPSSARPRATWIPGLYRQTLG